MNMKSNGASSIEKMNVNGAAVAFVNSLMFDVVGMSINLSRQQFYPVFLECTKAAHMNVKYDTIIIAISLIPMHKNVLTCLGLS